MTPRRQPHLGQGARPNSARGGVQAPGSAAQARGRLPAGAHAPASLPEGRTGKHSRSPGCAPGRWLALSEPQGRVPQGGNSAHVEARAPGQPARTRPAPPPQPGGQAGSRAAAARPPPAGEQRPPSHPQRPRLGVQPWMPGPAINPPRPSISSREGPWQAPWVRGPRAAPGQRQCSKCSAGGWPGSHRSGSSARGGCPPLCPGDSLRGGPDRGQDPRPSPPRLVSVAPRGWGERVEPGGSPASGDPREGVCRVRCDSAQPRSSELCGCQATPWPCPPALWPGRKDADAELLRFPQPRQAPGTHAVSHSATTQGRGLWSPRTSPGLGFLSGHRE